MRLSSKAVRRTQRTVCTRPSPAEPPLINLQVLTLASPRLKKMAPGTTSDCVSQLA